MMVVFGFCVSCFEIVVFHLYTYEYQNDYSTQRKTRHGAERYTVSQIRTSDLPTLERERERERVIRILGKADRSLGYQVGCADHCTTTAVFG
jgi:hypothetical protein